MSKAATINELDIAGTETHGAPDPALHGIDVAASQLEKIGRAQSEAVQQTATMLRDQIDAMLRQEQDDLDTLLHHIEVRTTACNERTATINVMRDSFASLEKKEGQRKLPPSVTEFPQAQRRVRQA